MNNLFKKKHLIIPIIIGVILIAVGVVYTILKPEEEKEKKLDKSVNSSDKYIAIGKMPEKFKLISSEEDAYYGYKYDEGSDSNSNACIAVIEFDELKSTDEWFTTYPKDDTTLEHLTVNGIDWIHYDYDSMHIESNDNQDSNFVFHYYTSEIKDKTLLFSIGYTGENTGECFLYEKEILNSIYLAQ